MRVQRFIIPALILITISTFWQAAKGQFVWPDDDVYVNGNAHVLQGLTPANITWAFTTNDTGYSHPLTWLSLMLDSDLFGTGPRGYHTTNIILHTLAVVLLYLALKALTGAPWRSALVALLFAIHPLRVESVAWISERKDMLSGCFAFAALLAYSHYARRPHWGRYLLVAVLFILGLLSKPILVTLPCLFLLLDIWPLRRWAGLTNESDPVALPACPARSALQLILEKIPLLVLSGLDSAMAYLYQAKYGMVFSRQTLPLSQRLANIPIANARYLAKMVWFRGLYFKYIFEVWPAWQVAAATALLLITLAVCIRSRRSPWQAIGWFWYLGMLAPVSGLITLGNLAMADRFTYIPGIGLAVMLVWSLPDHLGRTRVGRLALGGAVVGVTIILAGFTQRQIGYWHDKAALFGQALKFSPNDPAVLQAMGVTLETDLGRPDLALPYYRKAVQLAPGFDEAQISLANLLGQTGRSRHDDALLGEAWEHWDQAAGIDPHNAQAFDGKGAVDIALKNFDRAYTELQRALAIDPGLIDAHYNLAILLGNQQRYPEALGQYQEILRLAPGDAETNYMAGQTLNMMGRPAEALPYLQKAVQLRPALAMFCTALGKTLVQLHRMDEGMGWLKQAVRLEPDNAQSRAALAQAQGGQATFPTTVPAKAP